MSLISTTKTNTVGNGESSQPALDKTGQFAVFVSDATNLSTDTSGLSAIYLKNTQTGELKAISNDKYGIAANTASLNPTISGDGRYVIFESTAVVSTNFNGSILFPLFSDFDAKSQTNKGGVFNIFLKDTQTNALTLVTPTFGDGDSVNAEITSNGKNVVFQSLAANFISNDTNGAYDIYVEDLQTETLKLVSSDSSGTIGNRASVNPSVSTDGLKVAFASDADNFLGFNNVSKNLNASPFTPDGNWSSSSSVTPENINVAIPVDNNMNRDVFVKNISTGAIQLVSQNYNGGAANGVSDQPSISTDGTKVVFRSFATNLTVELIKAVDAVKVQAASAYDNDIIYSILGNSRVFLNDLKTGTLSQLDILSDGKLPNGSSSNPQLSPDGNFVAFISDATNLVSNDNNGVADVFVKNLSTGELKKVSEDSTGTGNVVDFGFSGDSSTLAFSRLSGLEDNATMNVYSVVQVVIPPPPDEVEGGQIYTLSVNTSDVDEDNETEVIFSVSVSEPLETDVTIPFVLSGTASKNTDYQGSLTQTSVFTMPAGETSIDLSFIAKLDTLAEKDETLVLTLNPTDDSTITDNGQTVTIHNITPPFQGKKTADKWTGTKNDDTAFGNGGNHTLSSVAGDDIIDGGDGNDKITGGKGVDELTGGNGSDTFVFNKGDSGKDTDTADTITDLSKGDKIDLAVISKTFNFIKTITSDFEGSNLKLSASKFDSYIANVDDSYYFVYETTKNGTTHEIVGIGDEAISMTTKSGIFTIA